ncbi:MAG: hypothetical protein ACTSVI_12670 [Promethearchaeota archaeon]
MAENGLFITLYDEETLKLYIKEGIYGQLMRPIDKITPQSIYYRVLADFGATRKDQHIFFFRKRKIYYGGQITGAKSYGAFYLNGENSPLGRQNHAPLVWNEGKREHYKECGNDSPGIFLIENKGKKNLNSEPYKKMCHPFIIQFKDRLGLRGKFIISDQFYIELGEFPFPLPSNSISNLGFCTLTPSETKIILNLLSRESKGSIDYNKTEKLQLAGEPMKFKPKMCIQSINDAIYENHLEAAVIANPLLLPKQLRPKNNEVICRQVPISPFKPEGIDRADICYYDAIREDGAIPNTVIELKNTKAGKGEILQLLRYVRWLDKLNSRYNVNSMGTKFFMLSRSYTSKITSYIPENLKSKIFLYDFNGSIID